DLVGDQRAVAVATALALDLKPAEQSSYRVALCAAKRICLFLGDFGRASHTNDIVGAVKIPDSHFIGFTTNDDAADLLLPTGGGARRLSRGRILRNRRDSHGQRRDRDKYQTQYCFSNFHA